MLWNWVHPLARHELSAICSKGQVRVGISVEPFRPFVFPAVYTDEGVRVTGLDVELIREVADALTTYCGGQNPIVPTLHLTRFHDLFIEMIEGTARSCLSQLTVGISLAQDLQACGIQFRIFITMASEPLSKSQKWLREYGRSFEKQAGNPDTLAAIQAGLSGLTVAAQKGTTSSLYAEANLLNVRLLICDSLPASVETKDPHIDVILSKHSILDYVTNHVWPDWHLLTRNDGAPLLLTQENFSVVTVEENRRLQWFLNNLLYRLDETGRLEQHAQALVRRRLCAYSTGSHRRPAI